MFRCVQLVRDYRFEIAVEFFLIILTLDHLVTHRFEQVWRHRGICNSAFDFIGRDIRVHVIAVFYFSSLDMRVHVIAGFLFQ